MPRKTNKPKLHAIDVFAGGGGLTVGLKRAGFDVVAAVELEPHAFATYKANHPKTHAYRQDIRTIDGESLRKHAPRRKVDVLAGCPPCQGFSSLTAKWRRNDPRNSLVNQMGRLVEEIKPRCVMMENVPGLATKGKRIFNRFLKRLADLGYVTTWDVLQVANFGIPQSRRRLVLFAGKGFAIPLPEPTHERKGECLPKWRNVSSVLTDDSQPITLAESKMSGGPLAVNWNVVRTMSAENKRRIRQAVPGESWRKIPKRLRPECHKDKTTGFSNVYGRMAWDDVSPTITAGCTTLSKGRFGHPEQDRTISVREAATLQTFPSDYVFDTPFIDRACDIIGNALPCDFAELLARQCADVVLARRRVRRSR